MRRDHAPDSSEPDRHAPSDAAVIDAALAAVRDAQSRAPRDFLVALGAFLAALAVALLVVAVISGGIVQAMLLNLASEVLGAGLTVVLIDGLWKRIEAGASTSLDLMVTRLEERRDIALSESEREAWMLLVDEYRSSARRESPLSRLRSSANSARRLRELEARGNRTLEEFAPRRQA